MHGQIVKRYASAAVEICVEAQDFGKKGAKKTKVVCVEGAGFALLDQTVDKYESLVKRILSQNDLSNKFSEKYIERKLDSIIARTAQCDNKEEHANTLMQDFVDSLLSYDKGWVVLVPLSGLEMGVDSIDLGRITIFKMTQQKMEEFLTQLDNIALATKSTMEVKQEIIRRNHSILEALRGDTCTRFEVTAEPERAKERAEEETRRVLDILGYCIPFLYPSNLRVNISLKGEIDRQLRCTPMISSDGKSASLPSRVIGPIAPFALNNENIDKMGKIGAFRLFSILTKAKRELNDFEEALLRSIHWFSNHLNQVEIENQFLSLVTCLETLLTPRGDDPIGNSIAEGIAILLITDDGNRNDMVARRMNMKSRLKKLYRKRSGISHGGSKQVFESEVRELRMIAKILIAEMVRKKDEFQAQKDVLDWIDKQKFG